MDILHRAGGRPSLIYPHRIFPLRVLKQVLTMFFSLNPDSLRQNRDMVQFVLNPRQRYLPPNHRVYVYYNLHGRLRSFATVATLDTAGGGSRLFSEFNFPPFGYVLVLGTLPPHPAQQDITHFAWYDYDDVRDVPLRLPVLPTYVGVPGDYR